MPMPLPGAHDSLARDQTEGTHTPGHSLAAAATSSSLVLISDSVDAEAEVASLNKHSQVK